MRRQNYYIPRTLWVLVFLVAWNASIYGQRSGSFYSGELNTVSNWIFGDSCFLEFTDTGIIRGKKNFYSFEAASSISDNRGKIILYGNAKYIYNSSDSVILQTNTGHTSSHRGMIFHQFPGDSIVHFFYNSSVFDENRKLNLHYGRYSTISEQIIDTGLVTINGSERTGIISHQNGNDFWIANHEENSDRVFVFLLEARTNQIHPCPVEIHTMFDLGEVENGAKSNMAGELQFSPNGKYLAIPINSFRTQLGEFNSEYPMYTNIVALRSGAISVEFSPDSKLLYLSDYDITVTEVDSAKYKLYSFQRTELNGSSDPWLASLQLAPDGKIYSTMIREGFLGVIDNPNDHIDSIRYTREGLALRPKSKGLAALPFFNPSRFHTPAVNFSYRKDCSSNSYHFVGEDTLGSVSYEWLIKEKDSQKLVYRLFDKKINYKFPSVGFTERKYEVSCIAWNSTSRDTSTKELTIRPILTPDVLGNDTFLCGNGSLTLRTPPNLHCIHWMGEEPNVDPGKGPIVHYDKFHVDTFTVTDTGMYFVRVTDKSFCEMTDTIHVYDRKNIPSEPAIGLSHDTLYTSDINGRYYWYLDSNFILETNDSFLKIERNGVYQVVTHPNNGCPGGLSDTVKVNCNTSPYYSVPVIRSTGDTIWVDAMESDSVFLWYMDDNFLIETSQPFLVPEMNGEISVKVINSRGCESEISNYLKVDWVGIQSLDKELNYKVFPNPTHSVVYIERTNNFSGRFTAEVLNSYGEVLLQRIFDHKLNELDLSNFSNGVYSVRILDGKNTVVVPLILMW